MAAEEKMKFIFNLPCVTNITKSFICGYRKMSPFFYGKVMCTKSQPANKYTSVSTAFEIIKNNLIKL